MASIYKRADTWWVHYYVNGQSVDRSLQTKNERVACEKKRKLEAADALDQLEAPSNTPYLPKTLLSRPTIFTFQRAE